MSNRTEIVKRCGLVGAGAGVGLYAFFGLMQGAAIGGAAGLGLVNYLFGESTLALMANELLPRIVIAASMLAGVLLSCVTFVVAGGTVGAIGGVALSTLVSPAEDAYMVPEAAAKKD